MITRFKKKGEGRDDLFRQEMGKKNRNRDGKVSEWEGE